MVVLSNYAPSSSCSLCKLAAVHTQLLLGGSVVGGLFTCWCVCVCLCLCQNACMWGLQCDAATGTTDGAFAVLLYCVCRWQDWESKLAYYDRTYGELMNEW